MKRTYLSVSLLPIQYGLSLHSRKTIYPTLFKGILIVGLIGLIVSGECMVL
ncbi:hypothetical protein [Staphylothermus marinus]|uniref:hypothetical protein n=1 Tax=Staphylothermus marinus TaxID=2280 RepID=UPI00146F379C|nr:hypothetical protein [Staphylothermus marinus]